MVETCRAFALSYITARRCVGYHARLVEDKQYSQRSKRVSSVHIKSCGAATCRPGSLVMRVALVFYLVRRD